MLSCPKRKSKSQFQFISMKSQNIAHTRTMCSLTSFWAPKDLNNPHLQPSCAVSSTYDLFEDSEASHSTPAAFLSGHFAVLAFTIGRVLHCNQGCMFPSDLYCPLFREATTMTQSVNPQIFSFPFIFQNKCHTRDSYTSLISATSLCCMQPWPTLDHSFCVLSGNTFQKISPQL